MQNLGIDFKLLIAQAINFVLFFLVFKRFLAKPFAKFINDEQKNEAEKEKLAAEVAQKVEDVKKKQEALEKEMKKKTEKAILEAKKAGEEVRQNILEQANQEAQQIKEKAKKQAQETETSLLRKAEEKAVDLSFFMVDQALKDAITPELRKKITQAILKNSKAKVI